MKFTLNTLGAPGWKLEQVAQNARAYGYAGVDVRLIDGEVISLESVRANRQRLRTLFQKADLPIAVLGTSVRLAADPQGAEREVAEWIDLAAELGVPVIRVYGGMRPEGVDLDAASRVVGETLARIAPRAQQAGVAVGIETHDDFSSAASVARALELAPARSVGALWDMLHTARMGETPSQVLGLIGDRVLNVHLKDARRRGDKWDLCLLGEGEVPVKEGLRLLKERGYDDFISVEWEKKWHPEIAEPEVAFPQHLELLNRWVGELGPQPAVRA